MRKSTRVAIALALGLAVAPVFAATIIVSESVEDDPGVDNGLCSLREAVIAANTNSRVDDCNAGDFAPTVDIIEFAPALDGTAILLSIDGADEDGALTGDLDLTEAVVIRGNGMGGVDRSAADVQQVNTFIAGNEGNPDDDSDDFADRIFEVHGGVAATFEDLVIARGRDVSEGGGIRAAVDSSLTLNSVALLQNSASSDSQAVRGGGIAAFGELAVRRSAFLQNAATALGGGSATPTAHGGGLAAAGGTATFEELVFLQNVVTSQAGAAAGGGLVVDGTGGFSFDEGLFAQNIVFVQGAGGAGGAALLADPGGMRDATLHGNVVTAGPAHGGGLMIRADVTLTNATLSGNRASGGGGEEARGGGLSADGTVSVSLNNVTVIENEASAGGDISRGFGGGVDDRTSGATVALGNTIVAGNTAKAGGPDCIGGPTSDGFNVIGDDSDCGFSPNTGDQVGTAANPIDPRLGALGDNGGSFRVGITDVPHLTHRPAHNSPAVDGGDPGEPGAGGTCAERDQRGRERPIDGDDSGIAACDSGSVERDAPALLIGGGSGGGCTVAITATSVPLDPTLLLLAGAALLGLWLRSRAPVV